MVFSLLVGETGRRRATMNDDGWPRRSTLRSRGERRSGRSGHGLRCERPVVVAATGAGAPAGGGGEGRIQGRPRGSEPHCREAAELDLVARADVAGTYRVRSRPAVREGEGLLPVAVT